MFRITQRHILFLTSIILAGLLLQPNCFAQRMDPLEVPIGMWGTWTTADWEFAYLDLQSEGLLEQSFDELAATNSTFIYRGIANEFYQAKCYDGLESPTLDLALGAGRMAMTQGPNQKGAMRFNEIGRAHV